MKIYYWFNIAFKETHLYYLYNNITFIMKKMLLFLLYKPVTKQVLNIRT